MKIVTQVRLLVIAMLFCGADTGIAAVSLPVACTSPDGSLAIEFSLRASGMNVAVPHYRVRSGTNDVVCWSRLGFNLADHRVLGDSCEVVSVKTRTVREKYNQFPGKRSRVVSEATEVTVRLRERAKPNLRWNVTLRAYDDGVAFRYEFQKQAGWSELTIANERTQFAFPTNTQAYALPLDGFTTSYESRYQHALVRELPTNGLFALPLLLKRADGGWAAITEANVNEFAGMYLAPTVGDASVLSAQLSPLPSETNLVVRATLPHVSPWRIVMVADRAGRFIESDIVLNLSAPSALKDVSWIKTGKTTFPWWNGYQLDGVSFKPGLNTATIKHYLDFCAANGIQYHSLDGVGDTAWYGGPIVPYEGADVTKALPAIDLPEVLAYAKIKGVRLRLWMHWQAAEKMMDTAFPLYRKWGIEGVMLDFMDRDDQEMNRFVRRAVKCAAENHLTITLHGCPKPTGLERTYPNLLTHEGVLNLEYNKWDVLGCPPEHQVTVPFTRMLAGPLDFHQGSFRTVAPENFQPRNDAPLVMGTPARTLASYVVFQNHLSMIADSPSAYAGHPVLPVLAKIPTTWDDTRVVAESVGEFVAIARRHDNEWHIGAMTDRQARKIKLPLVFLGRGNFSAELWIDAAPAKFGLAKQSTTVTAADELTIELEASGGAYLKICPAK